MLAITMVAGAAVFGFVNGQAGSSAQQYGGQVQNQISALGERFVFAYTYFPQVSAPYNQVNITIIGNLAARNIPVLIVGNKTDLKKSDVKRIESAFPQYPVVGISAEKSQNIEQFYEEIFKLVR